MISVNFKYDDEIVFEMEGHANYGTEGNDIVCAAASSIAITSLKAMAKFLREEDYNLVEDDGYLQLKLFSSNKTVKTLLENMYETLEELESQFPKYIKISK